MSMISTMIRCKALVPHESVAAMLGAPLIVVEVLTISIVFMHGLWRLLGHRYVQLALESPQYLASARDTTCWYAQMSSPCQLDAATSAPYVWPLAKQYFFVVVFTFYKYAYKRIYGRHLGEART